MKTEERIRELGYELPEAAVPVYDYVPAVTFERTVYISGQLPKVNGEIPYAGRVPDEVTVEEAQECARICVLQGLACLKQEIGDLDLVERVIKVSGFVNSAPDFGGQPRVLDACSELLGQIFGEAGKHARAAVGMASLPRRTPIEIEFIFGLKK